MDIVCPKSSPGKLCCRCEKQPRVKWQAYCRECYRALRKVHYRKTYDPVRQRNYNMRARHTLSAEDIALRAFFQGGVCAVCKKPETRKDKVGRIMPLSVDHNHETGDIRELLCSECNMLLGQIERDRPRTQQLLKYLKKHDT